MFEQEMHKGFMLADADGVDGFGEIPGTDTCDITETLIACTGARDACLLRALPGTQDGFEAAPSRTVFSAFSRLTDSLRSVQANVERLLHADMASSGPFWTRDVDNVLCLPITIDGQLAACVMLSYPVHMSSTETSEAEKRAQIIAPLVRIYLRTADDLAAASRKLHGAMGFLNMSYVAAVLFDASGRMCLANKAALTFLDAHDGIRMGNRAPIPVGLKDASRFQVALDHQIAQNAVGPSTDRRSTVFLIQRQKERRPFVATLLAMPTPARTPRDPAVLLYLFDPSNEHFDHLDAISQLYGLSRVEARLAHHIVLGKTVEDAALAMRIKAPTARTYLKNVFAKTGTHRQIDLARLLILSTARIESADLPEALQ